MNTTTSPSRDLLKLCCRALWEKKAEDLRVLHVGAESSITDFLVLATATSEPHLRALRAELELALKASRTRLVGLEAAEQSGWTVVDAFDVIVHLFLPAQREHYGLENLWKDAEPVSVDELLDLPPPAPAPLPVPAAVVVPPRKPAAPAKPAASPKKKTPAKKKAPTRKKAPAKKKAASAKKTAAARPPDAAKRKAPAARASVKKKKAVPAKKKTAPVKKKPAAGRKKPAKPARRRA